MSAAVRSMAALTESAITPMMVASPSTSVSTMMTQVHRVTGLSGMPNFCARSTTGTTLPRRLMTPRTQRGVEGTLVTVA